LLTTPTSISDALKSAVSTDERHIMASYKYSTTQTSDNINRKSDCMLNALKNAVLIAAMKNIQLKPSLLRPSCTKLS